MVWLVGYQRMERLVRGIRMVGSFCLVWMERGQRMVRLVGNLRLQFSIRNLRSLRLVRLVWILWVVWNFKLVRLVGN